MEVASLQLEGGGRRAGLPGRPRLDLHHRGSHPRGEVAAGAGGVAAALLGRPLLLLVLQAPQPHHPAQTGEAVLWFALEEENGFGFPSLSLSFFVYMSLPLSLSLCMSLSLSLSAIPYTQGVN